MDRNKAKKIAEIMKGIEKCEGYLDFLSSRSYDDEFEICYHEEKIGIDPDALSIFSDYYMRKLAHVP
jgi:hypothetical protein